VDSAIYELFYSAVNDSFSGDFVWPHAVLVLLSTLPVGHWRIADVLKLSEISEKQPEALIVRSLGTSGHGAV